MKSSAILNFNAKNYKKELSTLLMRENLQPKKIYQKKSTKIIHEKAMNKLANLVQISINNKRINLVFDKKLISKDVKSFTLKGKIYYKKVFDFNAFLSLKPKIKTPNIFKNIRIAQFNKNTFRLVFDSRKVRKYYLTIRNKNIIIDFYKIKPTKRTVPYINIASSSFSPNDKIIVLDPGHGGKDSGAIGYRGKYEKRAVLAIALKCSRELKKRGYKVYLTRKNDTFVKLRSRTNFANHKNADLFISIHANAAPRKSKYLTSKGVETYFLSTNRSQRSMNVAALENRSAMEDMDYYSKNTFLNVMNREKIIQANKMALDIQQGILKSIRKKYRIIDGGVREAPFWVLVGAQMPAILIETGYITNPTEGTRLFNFQYQNLLAKGIADGVDNYFLKN